MPTTRSLTRSRSEHAPPEWTAILLALGQKAPLFLAILVGGYFLLVAMAAIVATFHGNYDRRADARKVLKRLLPYGRRHRSWSRGPKTLPPPDGDERLPEQVASAQATDRARPERHG
jgi:hypothetical protein